MIKSVYKLDPRIKDISDIQSPIRYDDSFVGEICYFANSIWEFEDLERCDKGTLSKYIEEGYSSLGNFTAEEFEGDDTYVYFIPEKLLKSVEKKYRPYTLNEFVNQFSLGDEIILRPKSDGIICHKLFVEYAEYNDGDDTVFLGSSCYGLTDLYEDCEIYTGEGWRPFGVEVEE